VAALRLPEDPQPVLLHGDLHHFNILSSDRGWLAIDPKGVIGPAAFDIGALLINPWVVSGRVGDAPRVIHDRIAALSGRLGIDRQTVRDWGLVRAVLSACWSLEEGQDWEPAMQCAAALKGA
jgi:streptomycin 6-kinase